MIKQPIYYESAHASISTLPRWLFITQTVHFTLYFHPALKRPIYLSQNFTTMSNTTSVENFKTQLLAALPKIPTAQARSAVQDLVEEAEKKDKDKEKEQAETPQQRPRPGDDPMPAIEAQLSEEVLQEIEQAAGKQTRELIEALLAYTKGTSSNS